MKVSIVSIHADQSRHVLSILIKEEEEEKFQSYQFMQINPDNVVIHIREKSGFAFQSYQFMQINPDIDLVNSVALTFNQVSIVSIHADQSRQNVKGLHKFTKMMFQSYQFMQINPDCIYNYLRFYRE